MAVAAPQRTILCVEDYEPTRGVMAAALRALSPVFARDGEEALRKIRSAAFDAYIVDQWLPDYSGIALCRDIRRVDPHVPIVFFTIADREELRERAMNAGATTYLSKTVEYTELRERMQTLLAVGDLECKGAEDAAQEALAALQCDSLSGGVRAEASRVLKSVAQGDTPRKAHVRDAYVGAGGTLSRFERWWHAVAASARPADI